MVGLNYWACTETHNVGVVVELAFLDQFGCGFGVGLGQKLVLGLDVV